MVQVNASDLPALQIRFHLTTKLRCCFPAAVVPEMQVPPGRNAPPAEVVWTVLAVRPDSEVDDFKVLLHPEPVAVVEPQLSSALHGQATPIVSDFLWGHGRCEPGCQ